MSGKCYKKENIGIAYVDVNDYNRHKGLALRHKEIERLIDPFREDYADIYAVCIFMLIRNEIESIHEMIICGDEPFNKVKAYLIKLSGFKKIRIIQLDSNTKSLAHGKANAYRKRGLKEVLWTKGIRLNVIKIEFKDMQKLLKEINKR